MLASYDYKLQHKIYRPNARIDFEILHGDLIALGQFNKAIYRIADKRRVSYIIDSIGFRNDKNYNRQPYLLVGDSFVAGSGNSQEDILSSQLKQYHINAYNLAISGDLPEYAQYVKQFFNKFNNNNSKILLFVFEGNDFDARSNEAAEKIVKSPGLIKLYLKELYIYRFIYSLYYKTENKYFNKDAVSILKTKGTGVEIGFLNLYIEVTKNDKCVTGDNFDNSLRYMAHKIGHVFFIPTKYRTYYDLLDINNNIPLPNAQWEYLINLCKSLNLNCINLTEHMKQRSKELLYENKYTYWRDDTHWNKYGIAVAAKVVSETIVNNRPN